jgi:glycine cleavage system regulatory protein
MLLINMYHEYQIPNTSTGVSYDIRAACTFFADETINIYDLKRQIYVDLKLLPSHFNITISARINTAPPSSGVFFIVYLS